MQQSNEGIAAPLSEWFECLIGEEGLDEELDDLCLLLDYCVRSWGAQLSYTTYTSWWEVEGSLEPEAGTFVCTDVASLRKRLLEVPIEQFGLVVELAYQARSKVAELEGEQHLPTGPALLRAMAVWLVDAVPESARAEPRTLPQVYARVESDEQRRSREQVRVRQAQACQQGYLVVFQDTS